MADFPDYASILANDPLYGQALKSYQAAVDAARSQWQYLQGQANQQYNGPQGIFQRLVQGNQQNRLGIANTLGARGLDHSGEFGYENRLEQRRYGQAKLDATTQLQNYLNQVAQAYTGAAQNAGQGLLTAAQDAYTRNLNLYELLNPGGPAAPSTVVPQPTVPGFHPVAAQQNPYNPSAVGPGSTSLANPNPAPAAPRAAAFRSAFANPRGLAY